MARRIDANQQEIVKAIRQTGASVLILSNVGKGCPDLLVGLQNHNYLFEIKDGKKPPSQRKLTELEEVFFNLWRGQVSVINSLEEALQFINEKRISHGKF